MLKPSASIPKEGDEPVDAWTNELYMLLRGTVSLEHLYPLGQIGPLDEATLKRWAEVLQSNPSDHWAAMLSALKNILIGLKQHEKLSSEIALLADGLGAVVPGRDSDRIFKPAVIDINFIIGKATDLMRRKSLAVKLEVRRFPQELAVEVHAGQLFLACLALLDNAIAAAGTAGRDAIVKVHTLLTDKKTEIVIANTGDRIQSDKENWIGIQPFSTKSGGTGLGLCFAKIWIETDGGTLNYHFDSKTNLNIFTVAFMRTIPPAATIARRS
jgi:signal transduction histidine kinase